MNEQSFPIHGPTTLTEQWQEIFAFHLHRFLARWLDDHNIEQVTITSGFEHSDVPDLHVLVSRIDAQVVTAPWTFSEFCENTRSDKSLQIGTTGELRCGVPLRDNDRRIIGFAVLPGFGLVNQDGLDDLARHATEALRVARRNAVRLFFDDTCQTLDLKQSLYALFDAIPGWLGADQSVVFLAPQSLESITLRSAERVSFRVIADRLFSDDDGGRLVGLGIPIDISLIKQTLAHNQSYWMTDDSELRVHRIDNRPHPKTVIHIPLIVEDEGRMSMLGVLRVGFKRRRSVFSATDADVIQALSESLGEWLQQTGFFSVGARKLQILRDLRALSEASFLNHDPVAARDEFTNAASRLLADRTEVPSVAAAYLAEKDGARILKWRHPQGWTEHTELDLPVDKLDDSAGVSVLAIRLKRQVVLAGGRAQGDDIVFNNTTWVHEETGELADSRTAPEVGGDGWVPLSAYYKPARRGAYATLAYPIRFADRLLGVVTIEVERATPWFWWTGYGSNLFWRMVAEEFAMVFYRSRPTRNLDGIDVGSGTRV